MSSPVHAIFRARHLHEAEPARLVRIPIPNDGHSVHPTVSSKQLADVLFACIEAEVSDENVLHGSSPQYAASLSGPGPAPGFFPEWYCAEIPSRNRKRYSSWSCFSWNCRQSFEEIAPERAVFFYSQNPGMEVVDDVETSVSSWDRLHPHATV